LESVPIISLDNCIEDIGGPVICQMVERPTVKVRVLGLSKTPECEWRGTLLATGNNVTLKDDMTRRGLICNLDAVVECPETREFAFNPIERVLKDRGAYIAAALTISRAFIVAGDKVSCGPLGSFDGWCKFVREPLVWLGEADPVKSQEQARAEDKDTMRAVAVFEAWEKHLTLGEAYKTVELIALANEQTKADSFGVGWDNLQRLRPDLFDAFMEVAPDRRSVAIDARGLGQWLGKVKGRVVGGRRIVVDQKTKSHGNQWKLICGWGVGGLKGVSSFPYPDTYNF
jgi:hypothetical protein